MTNAKAPKKAAWWCGILALLIGGTIALSATYKQYLKALYPTHHADLVLAAAQEYEIAPSLIYAVIHTESHFDPAAASPANAKGLMQLTDDTFRWALTRSGQGDDYSPADIFIPSINIRMGAYVLSLFREQFDETQTALAAYNAGQGRVDEWLKNELYSADGVHLDTIPYPETKQYVQRVLTAQKRYQRLYHIA